MVVKDQFQFTEKQSEARWNAVMDALEMNWLSKISDTQAEYQEERMKLIESSRDKQS